uniref:Guanylate kinase/L-type calcium channel beta subunit domain-containing protein n=1 Tax=Plectus sambesii TaxID=2011161 RepID=A0A914UJP2_9BILA
EGRLRARLTETEESLQKRLKHAQEDLNAIAAEPQLFDHVIINDTVDQAYEDFKAAIADELQAFKHSKQ